MDVSDVIVCTCLLLGRKYNSMLLLNNGISLNFPFSVYFTSELFAFYVYCVNDLYLKYLSLNYSGFGPCCPFSKHMVFL